MTNSYSNTITGSPRLTKDTLQKSLDYFKSEEYQKSVTNKNIEQVAGFNIVNLAEERGDITIKEWGHLTQVVMFEGQLVVTPNMEKKLRPAQEILKKKYAASL